MKKIYSQPSVEIFNLTQTDVITASYGEDNVGGAGTLFDA